MIRLFLLYAILIFAKKAPQLIKDLLNIKGDNIGLKGLSIKNKLGEAALVGGAVKKGMTGIEGGIKKGIGAAAGGLKGGFTKGFASGNGNFKDKLKNGIKEGANGMGKGFAGGIISGAREGAIKGDTKGMFSGSYKDTKETASEGNQTFWNKKIKQPVQGVLSGIEAKGFNAAEIQRKKDADVLKRRVISMLGTKNGNDFLSGLSVDYNDPASYSKYIDSLKKVTKATDANPFKEKYGSDFEFPPEYQTQNILAARKKALAKFESLNSQFGSAKQSGDTELAKAIQKEMTDLITQNQALFAKHDNLGIEAVDCSYVKDDNGKPTNVNKLSINISTEIAKNTSALSDADNMVKAVEEKPKPAGDK